MKRALVLSAMVALLGGASAPAGRAQQADDGSVMVPAVEPSNPEPAPAPPPVSSSPGTDRAAELRRQRLVREQTVRRQEAADAARQRRALQDAEVQDRRFRGDEADEARDAGHGLIEGEAPDVGATPAVVLDGSTTPEQVLQHLLQLENHIIQTQQGMAQTLQLSIRRMQGPYTEVSDEERRALVQRALLFNRQLQRLKRQLPRLSQALEDLQGEGLPPAASTEVRRLREIIEKNQLVIAERHRVLRELYEGRKGEHPELAEELDALEKEEPPEEFDVAEAPDAEAEPVPEDTAEAAALLEFGAVETPRHLAEIFERIHEDETPKGSLEAYQRYAR